MGSSINISIGIRGVISKKHLICGHRRYEFSLHKQIAFLPKEHGEHALIFKKLYTNYSRWLRWLITTLYEIGIIDNDLQTILFACPSYITCIQYSLAHIRVGESNNQLFIIAWMRMREKRSTLNAQHPRALRYERRVTTTFYWAVGDHKW